VVQELPDVLVHHSGAADFNRRAFPTVRQEQVRPGHIFITNTFSTASPLIATVNNVRVGITGHSMGGHGALTIALKNPTHYRYITVESISKTPQCVMEFNISGANPLYGLQ
jgi:dienelactone hydrolase